MDGKFHNGRTAFRRARCGACPLAPGAVHRMARQPTGVAYAGLRIV